MLYNAIAVLNIVNQRLNILRVCAFVCARKIYTNTSETNGDCFKENLTDGKTLRTDWNCPTSNPSPPPLIFDNQTHIWTFFHHVLIRRLVFPACCLSLLFFSVHHLHLAQTSLSVVPAYLPRRHAQN